MIANLTAEKKTGKFVWESIDSKFNVGDVDEERKI